jgi:hypothetical protein
LAAAIGLAALLLTNCGAMLAAYVSIRVQIAVLQNTVKRLEIDVNNIAGSMRGGKIRKPQF